MASGVPLSLWVCNFTFNVEAISRLGYFHDTKLIILANPSGHVITDLLQNRQDQCVAHDLSMQCDIGCSSSFTVESTYLLYELVLSNTQRRYRRHASCW